MNYIVAFINPGSSDIEIVTGDESVILPALFDYADPPHQFTSMRSAISYIKNKMPMESGEAITIVDSIGRTMLKLSY
jgi:hypothetical protein